MLEVGEALSLEEVVVGSKEDIQERRTLGCTHCS